jgi:lipoprotein-anchoring transpeptidase ErfK/SrfK
MIKSEFIQLISDSNPDLYERDVGKIVNTILTEITGALVRCGALRVRHETTDRELTEPAAIITLSYAECVGHKTSMRVRAFIAALAGTTALVLPALAEQAPPTSASSLAGRDLVAFDKGTPRSIVVRTNERRLYFVLGDGHAIRYPVGVGRLGMQWTGQAYITGKHVRPAWSAPADMRRKYSTLPRVIAGGSPRNPMGVAALTLSGGDYAIHGTNAPDSIGGFVSHGCIRMYNADILDLYNRVRVGTPVTVTR